jgi:hypothetical protein
LEKDLVKILMLQEVLARRWPSHGIRPYGPCTIFRYKMEEFPSVFFSELHYHYYHLTTMSTNMTAAEHKVALLQAWQEQEWVDQEAWKAAEQHREVERLQEEEELKALEELEKKKKEEAKRNAWEEEEQRVQEEPE